MSRLREWFTDLRSNFVTADPDLQGLRRGALAVSSLTLTLLLMRYVVLPDGKPVSVMLFAGVMGMFSGALVRDASIKDQVITNAAIPVVASAVVFLATVLTGKPWVSEVAFIGVIAAAVWVRRFGPRGFTLGQVAFISYFFCLFLGATTDVVPRLVLGVVVGAASAAVMRFLVLRDMPQKRLRRLLRAYDKRCQRFVRDVHRGATQNRTTPEGEHRLAADLDDIDGLALRIDATAQEPAIKRHLSNPDGLSEAVFASEAQAVELASALRSSVSASSSERAQRIDDGTQALRASLHTVSSFDWTQAAPENSATEYDDNKDAEAVSSARISDESRLALQASTACALTIVAGQALSSQRWYWAVIACFLVFINSPTRAANVRRAIARITGTALGIVVGLVMAEALRGAQQVELLLLLVFVFVAFWLFNIAYSVTITCFTIVLALLYSLQGTLNESVLVLRLEESAVGAVIGGVIALVLVPRKGRSAMDDSIRTLLLRSEELLATIAEPTQHGGDRSRDAVRRMDEAFRELRLRTNLSISSLPGQRSRDRRHELFLLSGVRHRLRMLAAQGTSGVEHDDLQRTRRNLSLVRDALVQSEGGEIQLRDDGDTADGQAARLHRVDKSLAEISERR